MNEITFNNLPEAVTLLRSEISEIKQLLLSRNNDLHQSKPDILTIKQAAEMLCLSVPTLYGLVHELKIPFSKKGKLYFSRQELTDWIKSGRKKTIAEITAGAKTSLVNHKNEK